MQLLPFVTDLWSFALSILTVLEINIITEQHCQVPQNILSGLSLHKGLYLVSSWQNNKLVAYTVHILTSKNQFFMSGFPDLLPDNLLFQAGI